MSQTEWLRKNGVINSDLDFRNNDVVYLDDVFRKRMRESYILRYFDKIRRESLYRKIWNFFSCFEVINVADRFEAVISRYGSGNFYHKHVDVNPKHSNYRLITIVYYINREPQKFSGGSIIFYSDGVKIKLASQHNRAVIFPSNLVHEVEEVDMQEGTWGDGRFSINFWLGFADP
jgi:Rps23 Pro-64 3,4-dihydroxylase Tpa1-like proline 4-hydroxylase